MLSIRLAPEPIRISQPARLSQAKKATPHEQSKSDLVIAAQPVDRREHVDQRSPGEALYEEFDGAIKGVEALGLNDPGVGYEQDQTDQGNRPQESSGLSLWLALTHLNCRPFWTNRLRGQCESNTLRALISAVRLAGVRPT